MTAKKSSPLPLGLALLWIPMNYLPRGWLEAQAAFLCKKVTVMMMIVSRS
jgi:hypothetical protein